MQESQIMFFRGEAAPAFRHALRLVVFLAGALLWVLRADAVQGLPRQHLRDLRSVSYAIAAEPRRRSPSRNMRPTIGAAGAKTSPCRDPRRVSQPRWN